MVDNPLEVNAVDQSSLLYLLTPLFCLSSSLFPGSPFYFSWCFFCFLSLFSPLPDPSPSPSHYLAQPSWSIRTAPSDLPLPLHHHLFSLCFSSLLCVLLHQYIPILRARPLFSLRVSLYLVPGSAANERVKLLSLLHSFARFAHFPQLSHLPLTFSPSLSSEMPSSSAASSIRSLSIAFSPPTSHSPSRPIDPTPTLSISTTNGSSAKRKGKGKAVGDVVGSTEGLGRVGTRGREGRTEGNEIERDEIESSDEGSVDGASQDEESEKENGNDQDAITGDLRKEDDGNEEEQEPAPPDRLNQTQDSGREEEKENTEEEEEEEGSGDEEDDDEEEEPTLKYARLGGSAAGILEKDSASALLVSNKYIVCRLSRLPGSQCEVADDKRRQTGSRKSQWSSLRAQPRRETPQDVQTSCGNGQ